MNLAKEVLDLDLELDLEVFGSVDDRFPVLVLIPDRPESMIDRKNYFTSDNYSNYIVLKSSLPEASLVNEFAKEFVSALKKLKVKRVTVAGVGAGGVLGQALTLQDRKLCRKLVLINSTCRLRPSIGQRVLDRLERILPFGLPLRRLSADFDSRYFSHRIDCPTLIVTTLGATAFEKSQSRFLERALPNAWHIVCEDEDLSKGQGLSQAVTELIEEFMDTPAKRPQKNIEGSELLSIAS